MEDIILALGAEITGRDPRRFAALSAERHAVARFAAGGLNHQAIAAIENACLDIAAKARDIPVHALFGGPFRKEISLYWSHCGTFRAAHPEFFERVLGTPPLASLDDFRALGQEAVDRGFQGVKINPVVFEETGPRVLNPGFVAPGLDLARALDDRTLNAIAGQASAVRHGIGPDTSLMIDFNFGFAPAALRRAIRAVETARPAWVEADLHDPAALAGLRSSIRVPIASLETLHGRRAYLPYLQAGAVDVAVVDVPWNGLAEAVRIAALAETFELNVAPHNFYGPLADLMSAHFCAAVGNVSLMEIEADDVPWKSSLLTVAPDMSEGRFVLPSGSGWGAEIDEDAARAHPWRRDAESMS